MFGYPAAEAVGAPVGLLVPPDLPDGDSTGVFARAMAGQRVHEHETWRRTKSGERIPVSVTAARMTGADGRVLGVSAVFRDLRTRRKAEAELGEALAAKDVLLTEVNHRVTNSLQLVSSLLSLQAARVRDPQLRQGLAEAQGRVGVVSSVHRRLYQSGTHGRIDDLGTFLRDLLADIVVATDPSGAVRFVAELPPAPLPTPIDRAVPLALALSELVTNAVKYAFPAGGAGGTVRLVLRPEPGGGLLAAVEDDGAGLPAGFDPAASGGVGMRVVLTLVRQLRGRLDVGVATGASGAAFCIHVPPLPPDAPTPVKDAT